MEDSRIGQVTHMKFFLGNREKLEEQVYLGTRNANNSLKKLVIFL